MERDCTSILSIGIIKALNESTGRLFRSPRSTGVLEPPRSTDKITLISSLQTY